MNEKDKQGSHKNIWYGLGRLRIEIPKTILKAKILNNPFLKGLHICSLGYYPKAKDHYTYRKNGLPESFLFYCVDGHGWYEINGERFDVGPNEFFILPHNTAHSYGSSDTHPWSIYWVHFGGDLLAYFSSLRAIRDHFKSGYIKNNGDIIAVFNKIYKTLELGYSVDNLLFANMCLMQYLSLFIYNAKHYSNAHVSDKVDGVDTAILFMQKNINENVTLNEISKNSNYSVSRFSSLFKQKTGYAPIDYFMQMKIQLACQQLDFTDQSIKSIALTMGFNDPYYFSKRFKQIIGISPQKYRLLKKD